MHVVPLDFQLRNNILTPVDEELYAEGVQFCKNHLAAPLDPRQLAKAWVVRSEDKVLAIAGIISRWEVAVFRSVAQRATIKLANRLNSYFADAGFRGQEMLLFMSDHEKPEQRCPNRERVLGAWNARPAERYVVSVR